MNPIGSGKKVNKLKDGFKKMGKRKDDYKNNFSQAEDRANDEEQEYRAEADAFERFEERV